MTEWDFRLINLFNIFYLLVMFSIVGLVIGAGDTTMNKELWSSGETDK